MSLYTSSEPFKDITESTDRATQISRYIDDLNQGKEVVLRVGDKQWEPVLKQGDFMVFGPVNLEQMGPGAIVLYRVGEKLVIRRVVKKVFSKSDLMILTKPINGTKVEAPLRAASVLARLLHVDRPGARVPASRLNRGIVDWLTAYGTESPFAWVGRFFSRLLPASMRKPEDDPHAPKPRFYKD